VLIAASITVWRVTVLFTARRVLPLSALDLTVLMLRLSSIPSFALSFLDFLLALLWIELLLL
jgi:hypothetical protein